MPVGNHSCEVKDSLQPVLQGLLLFCVEYTFKVIYLLLHFI